MGISFVGGGGFRIIPHYLFFGVGGREHLVFIWSWAIIHSITHSNMLFH